MEEEEKWIRLTEKAKLMRGSFISNVNIRKRSKLHKRILSTASFTYALQTAINWQIVGRARIYSCEDLCTTSEGILHFPFFMMDINLKTISEEEKRQKLIMRNDLNSTIWFWFIVLLLPYAMCTQRIKINDDFIHYFEKCQCHGICSYH